MQTKKENKPLTNNFDVFSGVNHNHNDSKKNIDKGSLYFDFVDSDQSSDEFGNDNIGKIFKL